MSSVQVAGHVCVDLTPGIGSAGVAVPGELIGVGPMRVTIGGVVGNSGRALAELGVDVSLAGSVGDDELGELCLRMLRAQPHTTVRLNVVPGFATSYSIVVQPHGVDRSFWHHTGANDAFDGECAITARHLLHLGYPSLVPRLCRQNGAPIVRLFERAHAQGVATSLDLAYVAANSPVRSLDWDGLLKAVLSSCDVFCPSWDDLASCLGLPVDPDRDVVASWSDRFLGWGAGIVLITLGEQGSHLRVAAADRLASLASCGIDPGEWAGTVLWTKPEPCPGIVVTNGAGDTYKAAFLSRLVRGEGPGGCLDFAAEIVARYLTARPLDATAVRSPGTRAPLEATGLPD